MTFIPSRRNSQRTIPEIRQRMLELASEHGLPELAQLAQETRRRFNGRRALPKSPQVTAQMAARIRVFADQNPGASFDEIGRHFNVNIGRVSEVLHGTR